MTDREIVIALAEKVMGWRIIRHDSTGQECGFDYRDDQNRRCTVYSWNPRTSIADAWIIVERMRELGFHFLMMVSHESGLAIASFYLGPHDRNDASRTQLHDQAPLAICRAALASIEHRERTLA
jgi:hypothetical protein